MFPKIQIFLMDKFGFGFAVSRLFSTKEGRTMTLNFKRKIGIIFVLMTAFLLSGSLSNISAQTVSGTMQGRVEDTNGDAVPGATVNITSQETGQVRSLITNDEGFYNAPFLPIGRYTVDATFKGFNKVVRDSVEVSLNNTSVVDFKLDPSVSGEVTITTEVPQINTTNQQIANSLTAEQIQDRPVQNQGSFLSLAETAAGFQQNPDAGSANNPTLSVGSSISFNGTGSRGATFQINGVNNDDSSENQNRQGASLATIKEFQVITNNFTAEFGRGYGAVVLVQTLSGTNKVAGSAYLYHNDSALNARSFFNVAPTAKPVNRRNQYGFTLGFPILKNKLFGFVSFDQTKNSGSSVYTRDIFLPSERDPANWFRITPANDTPSNRAFIQSVINRFPSSLVPNDPANRSPRTYVGQQAFNFPDEDYSGRFDWTPRQSDTLYFRYQYTRQQRLGDDVIIGERASQNNKQQNYGLTYTHVFSPQLVGEFRYGLGLRTTLANIQSGNNTPVIRFFNPAAISGSIIGNAAAFPIQRFQTDHQGVYNLSWVVGSKHFLKMGTDIRSQALNDFADNTSRGFYNFNATTCNGVTYGSGFIALINGCVNNYQKGYGNFFLENSLGEYNFYAEDNWKLFPNLTLNLGIRYEYVNAPRERENRISYGYRDDKDNVEPRLGAAYSPSFEKGLLGKIFGGPGQSSIRGGYGHYHGRLFQSIFAQGGASVRTNPPNAFFYNQSALANTTFDPTNLADPTRGFVFVPGPDPVIGRLARNLLVDPNLEMPYTRQWNVTFERQLPWATALRLSYTGTRGYGLLRYNFGNAPRNDPNGVLVVDNPNNAPTALYTAAQRGAGDPRGVDVRGQILRPAADVQCAGTGLSGIAVNATCPVAVPLGALEYSLRVPRTTERRPDPLYNGYSEVSNTAFTWYDGMTVELSKRLTNGLNFQATYVWSKALDTTSEATSFGAGDSNQTGNDLKASKALSRSHTPHRFTMFGTYKIPFLANRRDIIGQVLGGWSVSTVIRLVKGSPFTVTYQGVDLNLDNFSESRPVILDTSILGRSISNPGTSQQQLPTSAFRATTLADLNCCVLGRNTFFRDGIENVDLAFSKKFAMPFEGHSLSVRADLFNAFNKVQWGFPNVTWAAGSTTFGRLTDLSSTYAPRNIQVSLRYAF
jgi:hypothetical protein